jgi:hypothetical protein
MEGRQAEMGHDALLAEGCGRQVVVRTWAGADHHKANYSKLGLLIGMDFVKDPSKALELSTAVQILFTGMEPGSFTGKSLADYDVMLLTSREWQPIQMIPARG